MSDPVVVAMGDDKLKDSHGQDENPEVAQEEAKEASHTGTTEDGGEAAMEDVDTSSADKRASQDATTSPLLEPQHLSSHPADELHRPDSPTTSLITSLRTQLTQLSEQSHQLNTKLVASISRHADLEDQHFNLQHERDELRGKNAELTKVKETWEESMKTGLYVEQSQIKEEMQRLASGLVEEERKRGSAEQRRQDVENEVDDLATSLFEQANTMVAQERMGRLEAESRLKSTEENLAAAEAAVRDMQLHLQSLSTASAPSESQALSTTSAVPRKLLSSHVPYIEYISFVQHLRSMRPLREASKATFPPPLVTNLLTQPFLARAIAEDHDPTLRFDAAPDLSWLSRRGVTSAIVGGELVIEPVSSSTILAATTTSPADIGCSLCGKAVFPTLVPQSPAGSHFGPPPLHPTQRNSASRFSLKPFFNSTSTSPGPNATSSAPPTSPLQSPSASPNPMSTSLSAASLPSVYIFRIAKSTTAPTATSEKESQSKSYPLCRSGWCLERLRATCALWHFIRTGLIQVVWTGDDGYLLQSEIAQPVEGEKGEVIDLTDPKPPLPPRKRSGWGLGFKSASANEGAGTSANANTTATGSSWTKGWGTSRSGTASPPALGGRKGSVDTHSIGAEKISDEPISVSAGLAAPLEIVPGHHDGTEPQTGTTEQGAGNEVPIIQATESSPLAAKFSADDTKTNHPAPGDVSPTARDHLHPDAETGLKRADSNISLNSTNKSEKFTTPQSEHVDMLDQEGQKIPSHPESESQVTEVSPESEQDKAEEKPKPPVIVGPPPVPKRAAARQRVNGAGESVDFSREGSPIPITPTTAGTEVAQKAGEGETSLEVGEAATPLASAGEGTIAPPPLPARHPQTPRQNRQSRIEEKTYLKQGDEEDWESKTWRMIVKLREDMWKTRIGVVDGEDE